MSREELLEAVCIAIALADDGEDRDMSRADAALSVIIPACQEVARGRSEGFDFQAALGDCRDTEYGYHNGRLDVAKDLAIFLPGDRADAR